MSSSLAVSAPTAASSSSGADVAAQQGLDRISLLSTPPSPNMMDVRYYGDGDGTSLASVAGSSSSSTSSSQPSSLQQIRNEKPWMNSVKYFTKIAVSPSALMKIMMHCQSGVQKGIQKGGNPLEVMGMLLGRPDPIVPTTLIVSDAYPLPIEGFETRVVADDENVVNHMIQLGESLELTRKDKFMGWYHSHPFDLTNYSHCFLSQTDLSTQLQWQRAEDPHGNPFVAIVVDPIRSLHQQIPELKAFRAYPPEYNSSILYECPDGSIQPIEQCRLEQWGNCWNRYYEIPIEYYMSTTSRYVMEQLTKDYLWIRHLVRTPDMYWSNHLCNCNKTLQYAVNLVEPNSSSSSGGGGASGTILLPASSSASAAVGPGGGPATLGSLGGSSSLRRRDRTTTTTTNIGGNNNREEGEEKTALSSVSSSTTTTTNASTMNRTNEFSKAVQQLSNIAAEHMVEQFFDEIKKQVFA